MATVNYNFKGITAIPTSKEFVDIVLSKTQRKTPTVIHRQYEIGRIREFYSRKIKFAQQTYHDKLSQILTEFPRMDVVNPFYANLMDILYDKDHYKIALGEITLALNLIDKVAKHHVKHMKYSENHYRCKRLKIAALGRMTTIIKKQDKTLVFLNEVRQHLARLPILNPESRTIILCGFPNVGKSSFMNTITRADVDVQPYAFTTKSLFVGHTDYATLRYQVIDTPGLLDQSLSNRNKIELQSISALSFLKAYIIFVMDPSEQCGYSMKMQFDLFEEMKPLFRGKSKMISLNKSDIIRRHDLPEEYQKMLEGCERDGTKVFEMSTISGDGISEVKNEACKTLLEKRVLEKVKSGKMSQMAGQISASQPMKRDNKERPPYIPESMFSKDILKKRKTERDIELEEGEDYYHDLKKNYLLKNEDEKYDVIPELWEGHNIADFIDPDIEKKLEELEREEGMRESAGMYEIEEEDEEALSTRLTAEKIREKLKVIKMESQGKKRTEGPRLPRTAKGIDAKMMKALSLNDTGREVNIDESTHIGRARSKSINIRDSRKRKREASESQARSLGRSASRARSVSRVTPRNLSGVKDEKMAVKLNKLARKAQRGMNRQSRKGEADRRVLISKPKHLFAGKSTIGKKDRR